MKTPVSNLMDQLWLRLFRALRIRERYPGWVNRVQGKWTTLYGRKDAVDGTNLYLARRIGEALLLGALLPLLLAANDPQPIYLLAGLGLGAVWVPYSIARLDRKLTERRREMLLDLPELLHRLTLLLEAGETLPQALQRCDLHGSGQHHNVFWRELAVTVQQIRHNESLSQALEQWGKRCAVQEVTVFVSLLLVHYRRGGGELSLLLRGMTRELWEKRKSIVRSMGEEASSKLIFPMMVVFLLIMTVVSYPALIMID